MRTAILILLFLLGLAFTLATYVHGWFEEWEGNRARSASTLELLLGDGRRMFATHFFVKADVYYHSGYYPSIFDRPQEKGEGALAIVGSAGLSASLHDHADLATPQDWIERFGRKFMPNSHTHLDLGGPGGDSGGGDIREMLPWLRVTAELDPGRIEAYTVAAYWLRTRLDQVDEAEAFLREGLRANPGNPTLLFEIGKIQSENRKHPERARNLWELALRNWEMHESGSEDPDLFTFSRIVGQLALLEEREGNLEKALVYLEKLRAVSPQPGSVERWMEDVRNQLTRRPAEGSDGEVNLR
jgi:tetratricopeptide (TPR) repeat protein